MKRDPDDFINMLREMARQLQRERKDVEELVGLLKAIIGHALVRVASVGVLEFAPDWNCPKFARAVRKAERILNKKWR